MAKFAMRKCDKCGELFVPRSSRQHFCRKQITRNCLVCGEEFTTNCSDDMKLTCAKAECKKVSSSLCEPTERVCPTCGVTFTTIKNKQIYCNQEKEAICEVCGNKFTYICNGEYKQRTCSEECANALILDTRKASAQLEQRVCKWCGKLFTPREHRDVYCYDTHFQTCAVCGKQFEIDVRKDTTVKTCSKECRYILAKQNTDIDSMVENLKHAVLEKYGVDNVAKLPEFTAKAQATSLERYGKEWYTQTDEYREKLEATCKDKYGVHHHLMAKEVIGKRTETVREKYGVDNVSEVTSIQQKIVETMMSRYGVDNALKVPEFRRKAIANARDSKLELKICNLFDNYSIKYERHHIVTKDNRTHEFDFLLTDYKMLIDADGLYYHSYLDDPDGFRVRDDLDEVRLSLIPEGYSFHVIVENDEDRAVLELVKLIESTGLELSKLDSYLFHWCRSIEFPYPYYDDKRIAKEWIRLKSYDASVYHSNCRVGSCIVRRYHKSIYHSRCGSNMSPYEGWYDDDALRKVIRNRLIYKNDVDPSKILAGFNISKICPCVSVFNPMLARYLTLKYLNEFQSVFDPFSGFSGRLLGVTSTGRGYIGQDINKNTVAEANEIIEALDINACVLNKDIVDSVGQYECLLTCPPYSNKEVYGSETIFKTCDEWIDECLARFNCLKYVFVVDETSKYKDNVAEILTNSSHFGKNNEYVIVI